MNFEKLATSEAAVMNDPEDPSTFTFHKMKGRCMNIEYICRYIYFENISTVLDIYIALDKTDFSFHNYINYRYCTR